MSEELKKEEEKKAEEEKKKEEEKKAENEDKGKGGKTYTEAELTKLLDEGKGKGKNELIKQFGFESESELKGAIDKMKSILGVLHPKEEEKGEDNKVNAELEKIRLEAEVANAKVEALGLGAKPENVDDIIALARIKKTENNDWKTAVTEVKTKHGNMFVEEYKDDTDGKDDKKKKDKKQGTGGEMSKRKKKDDDDGEDNYGAKLAKSNKATTKHESYF